ncbi:MAG: NAD(P)/FAD-dependent oxidoreductase [Anaerolineae bacterium]
MPDFQYVIVGGGMTADAAVEGIRAVDESGSIGIVSAENRLPYDRPPLSKDLLTEEDTEIDDIKRGTGDREGVTIFLGRHIVDVNRTDKIAVDDRGQQYTYDALLLATGGSPRQLPFDNGDLINVIYYRTLGDYKHLDQLIESRDRFAVIGGGFIGMEVSASLAMNGKQVTTIFPEDHIGGLVFPEELASHITTVYEEKGVNIRAKQTVKDIKPRGRGYLVTLDDGETLEVDGVIVGIGIEPNTELAENIGLEVDNGIQVDGHLRTSDPSIYAAGDVANFFNPALNKRIRVEHEDNANQQGEMAGRNMAGEENTYDYLPFFYSDIFDMGYEAVGEIDSALHTTIRWKEPDEKGWIFYTDPDDTVRGVLLWNTFGEVDSAREMIGRPIEQSETAVS